MKTQSTNYSTNQFDINPGRHGGKRLGDRAMSSNSINGKRYFSSLDAEIFFGETHIDEIVQINWSVEQATMPLFGYNSYTFDDLAIGARQIGGSFVVNFTKSGFMYDVLRNAQAISRCRLRSTVDANENSKLSWQSNFDKENNASWDRSFNIRIGYGDYTQKGNHSTMIILHCVQLTGCQQVLSTSGGVIGEVYSFIAKDIRYEMDSLTENTTGTNPSNNNTAKDTIKQDFVFAVNELVVEKHSEESRPDNYSIKLRSSHSGGIITDIKAKIKEDNRLEISTIPIGLGNSNESITAIPNEHNIRISNCIAKQIKMGVKEEDVQLFLDLIIDYKIDGVQKLPVFKKNIKIKVTNKPAQ